MTDIALRPLSRLAPVLGSFFCIAVLLGGHARGAVVGVNDFYLTQQYMGTASGGDGSEAYRQVEVAMANKAMRDAAVNGASFVRFAATGYLPSLPGQRSDLALWMTDPDRYWERIDALMAMLDRNSLKAVVTFIWNSNQFPAITNETLRDLVTNPNSKSFALASKYIEEFVRRYRDRSVLFYELTNELNLGADLDLVGRCRKANGPRNCATSGNYTTNEMIEFCRQLSVVIRKFDLKVKLSSGFSLPRRAAEHMRARPEWVTGNTDFTPDTQSQFEKNLTEIHSMVDILGVHIYPDTDGGENTRYGSTDPRSTIMLESSVAAAKHIGKPLYVGEYGDTILGDNDDKSFTIRIMNRIAELKPEYSSPWVWEFYQKKTYLTHDTSDDKDSMEPGMTDRQIARFRKLALDFGHPTPDIAELRSHAPNLVLTWPLNCAVLDKSQNVHAAASDDAGRAITVNFIFDDKNTIEPHARSYEKEFSTEGVSPGSHVIKVQAIVPGGPISEASVRVIVGTQSAPGTCR